MNAKHLSALLLPCLLVLGCGLAEGPPAEDDAEPVGAAQQALLSWEDVASQAAIGIHRVDGDATFIWLNAADAAAVGYAPEELLGTDIRLIHYSQWTIDSMLAHLVAGEVLTNYPARLIHKDGHVVFVSIDSRLLSDGLTGCFTTVVSESVYKLLWLEHLQAGTL